MTQANKQRRINEHNNKEAERITAKKEDMFSFVAYENLQHNYLNNEHHGTVLVLGI